MKKFYIEFTFQKEGIHHYPAALQLPELADVSFLGYPHRHMFHFTVKIEVLPDDREIEFILAKRWAENLFDTGIIDANHKSCEMLAEEMVDQVIGKYGDRDVLVKVSEDGENAGYCDYVAAKVK